MDKLRSLSKNELIQLIESIPKVCNCGVPVLTSAVERFFEEKCNRGQTIGSSMSKNGIKRRKKEPRAFDMSKFTQRHIALHIAYFGGRYDGFASQPHTKNTVENMLFEALKKTCLIDSRSSANYSRCGRTDKGVSALGQVISLSVRSSKPKSCEEAEFNDDMELCYPSILNRVLPEDIFVLGWAPTDGFSFQARFKAVSRTYRYFFISRDLNLAAMNEASRFLIGEHDFRNFCKMDVTNVKNFSRAIYSAKIEPLNPNSEIGFIEITGNAFLWHQIRCIAAILFLIGRGLEKPSLIQELLDTKQNPRKPVYNLADELALVLYKSNYDSLRFRYEERVLLPLMLRLERRLKDEIIRSSLTRSIQMYIKRVFGASIPVKDLLECDYKDACSLTWKDRAEGYTPILRRAKCMTYEERVQSLSHNKRKAANKRHGWNL